MDDATAYYRYVATVAEQQCVGGRGVCVEGVCGRPRLKRTLVQIFDVVVSIQMKCLKTDVEKGLTVKVVCCQLVGPNREGKSLRSESLRFCPRKGIRFIFRNR